MKKLFICFVLLSAIIIPLACGNQNNAPTGPIGGGPTITPTRTSTPGGAATSTFTPTPGGPTNTPTNSPTITPTFSVAAPAFDGNNGASSATNGAYYAGTGAAGTLYVAENDGINPEVQEFTNASGVLTFSGGANFVVVNVNGGGSTVQLIGPQGFASTNIQVNPLPAPPTNYYAILDENASGAATLYSGTNFNSAGATVNSWGTQVFNSPKCLTADTIGNFYVADTGNSYIEQWNMNSSPSQYPVHRWNDYYDFQLLKSMSFVRPYSVACDPNTSGATAGDIFVGDAGVPNSKIVEFTSGGTAVVANGIFYGIANCVVQGLAVDASDNVYVADSANHELEEYGRVAGAWSLLRAWTIPVGTVVAGNYQEFYPFNPTAICLTGSNIFVGDFTNQLISVFGP